MSLPPELVDYLHRQACEEAEGVAAILKAVGIVNAELSARVLIGMGVALRFCLWESLGFTHHRAMGAPTGADLLVTTCRSAHEPPGATADTTIARAWNMMLDIQIHHMAWGGPVHLDAPIELGFPEDEDLFVDALAKLLWATRGFRGTT